MSPGDSGKPRAPDSRLQELEILERNPFDPGTERFAVSDTVDASVRRKQPRTTSPIGDWDLGRKKPKGPRTTGVWPDDTGEDRARRDRPLFGIWPRATRQIQTGLSLTDTIKAEKRKPPLRPPHFPDDPTPCKDTEIDLVPGVRLTIPAYCDGGFTAKIFGFRGL